MNKLKVLISSNDIKQLIDSLKDSYYSSYINQVIIIEYEWVRINSIEVRGTLSYSDIQIQRNKLVEKLLILIDKIEEDRGVSASIDIPCEFLEIHCPNYIAANNIFMQCILFFIPQKRKSIVVYLTRIKKYLLVNTPINSTNKALAKFIAKKFYPDIDIAKFEWRLDSDSRKLNSNMLIKVLDIEKREVLNLVSYNYDVFMDKRRRVVHYESE